MTEPFAFDGLKAVVKLSTLDGSSIHKLARSLVHPKPTITNTMQCWSVGRFSTWPMIVVANPIVIVLLFSAISAVVLLKQDGNQSHERGRKRPHRVARCLSEQTGMPSRAPAEGARRDILARYVPYLLLFITWFYRHSDPLDILQNECTMATTVFTKAYLVKYRILPQKASHSTVVVTLRDHSAL